MSTAVDPFHERVARIALQVASRHGFVLGGGLALILHGALQRPTEDIDLFGPETASVPAAADAVRTALQDAGIRVADVPVETELADVIDGMDYFMAEMIAHPTGGVGVPVRVSLGHLGRTLRPVVLDVGPVMAMPDLIAWKVAALVNRAEYRDFVDVVHRLTPLSRSISVQVDNQHYVNLGARGMPPPCRGGSFYGAARGPLRRFTVVTALHVPPPDCSTASQTPHELTWRADSPTG